jgi:hypothetical protein
MSRTHNPSSVAFAEKVEATLPPSHSDLQKRVNELEQQLETLRPKESPLAKMTREQDEYLKRFEEEKSRKQEEDARVLEQARDAERMRQASLPQAPTTEQIRALADALSAILQGDFYGSSRAREQEVDVWPRWCALVDALKAATAIPTNGWAPRYRQSSKARHRGGGGPCKKLGACLELEDREGRSRARSGFQDPCLEETVGAGGEA